ncbi:hypothetical protein RRG08_014648 [Elysia crispata]|uniref:Uncharacterized protein n=1 Tax=Elysia crispata TaxID=231223 RepID=A0AAE0YIN4_9GAST|nr:hypothetical protein RRG08_014648 [Elysia crispata]
MLQQNSLEGRGKYSHKLSQMSYYHRTPNRYLNRDSLKQEQTGPTPQRQCTSSLNSITSGPDGDRVITAQLGLESEKPSLSTRIRTRTGRALNTKHLGTQRPGPGPPYLSPATEVGLFGQSVNLMPRLVRADTVDES